MHEVEGQVSMDWTSRMAAGTVGADRTRPMIGSFPLSVLLRYAVYGLILVTVLMFYVWSRVDVRRSAAELDVDALNALGFDDTLYETVAKYPAVPYDLSIIVPESVSHSDLHERILSAHEGWVKSADCTAVYRGDPIPEGEKSMTYRIVFQSDEATLEMDAVNEVVNGLVDRLGSELGGWLRT